MKVIKNFLNKNEINVFLVRYFSPNLFFWFKIWTIFNGILKIFFLNFGNCFMKF